MIETRRPTRSERRAAAEVRDRLWRRLGLGACLAVLAAAVAGWGAEFPVNSFDDAPDATVGDGVCATSEGKCTLRAAIQQANGIPGVDGIRLPVGTYRLSIQGIREDDGASGDLDIDDDLEIVGEGALRTIIDGNFIDRIFHVVSHRLFLADVLIRNGDTTGYPARPDDESELDYGEGGGIYMGAKAFRVDLRRTVVTHNRSRESGGGIYNFFGGLIADETTISNTYARQGGGIDNNKGILRLTNTTISGNKAEDPDPKGGKSGGLANGRGVLANVTIVNNSADNGEVFGLECPPRFTCMVRFLTVRNSIIGGPCRGQIVSEGYNVLLNVPDEARCTFDESTTDQLGVDPRLGPLQDNGGQTFTHALLSGSRAIDGGNVDGCTDAFGDPLTFDQRGVPRPQPQGGRCDVGAYEAGGSCEDQPDGALCDDANGCTTNDRCVDGRCVGDAPTNCDDADACTDDTCDPPSGCRHARVPGCPDVCGNGVLNGEPGEQCDEGEVLNGATGSCCEVDCRLKAADALCRMEVGLCDVPETCDGSSGRCPADELATADRICRPAVDFCDVGEACDGQSSDCPADGFALDGTPCQDRDVCTEEDVCIRGECSGTAVCSVEVTFVANSLETRGKGRRVRLKELSPPFHVKCESLKSGQATDDACKANGVCVLGPEGACSKQAEDDLGACSPGKGKQVLRAGKGAFDAYSTAHIDLHLGEVGKKLVRRALRKGQPVFFTVCVTLPGAHGKITIARQAEVFAPCPGGSSRSVCGVLTSP